MVGVLDHFLISGKMAIMYIKNCPQLWERTRTGPAPPPWRATSQGPGTAKHRIEQMLALSISWMHTSMSTFNACRWLNVGRSECCGKQFVNDLCGIHRAQLCRQLGTEPRPCRKCSQGVEIGDPAVLKGLWRRQREESPSPRRRIHPALMHELLLAAHWQWILPFIGLR